MKMRSFDFVLALITVSVSAIVYITFLCTEAYPGIPANLIVTCSGLSPKMTPLNPIWHILVALLSKLSFIPTALTVNIAGAILSAVSSGLVYLIVRTVIVKLGTGSPRHRNRIRTAARLGGISAAFSLAFCAPFWAAATRGHPATLHMLTFLLTLWFVLEFLLTRAPFKLMVAAFLCGLGTLESPAFLVAGPVFAAFVLCFLWIYDRIRERVIVSAGLCGFAAVCLSCVAAWRFTGTEGYELGGYAGYLSVLRFFWASQLHILKTSLPRIGWLMIMITSAVPAITAISVARDTLSESSSRNFYLRERRWSHPLLHLVLTAATVACLWNVASLAPWEIAGIDRAMLMPPLLICLTFGYLAAYWFVLPTSWWRSSRRPVKVWTRTYLGHALAGILLALSATFPFRNATRADSREGEAATAFAEDIIDCLDNQQWLITDGFLDDQLRIVAARRGRVVHFLDMSQANNPSFMTYVESLLTSEREKSAARLGPALLIREWIRNEGNRPAKAAFLVAHKLIEDNGLVAIPNRLFSIPSAHMKPINLDALLAKHERFWKKIQPRLDLSASPEEGASAVHRYMSRLISTVAGQLAALAEDTGRTEDARRVYSEARKICPENTGILFKASVIEARICIRQGDWKAAEEHLRSALSISPGSVSLLEQMVVVLLNLDKSADLNMYVSRLLHSDPDNVFGNHMQGRLQYKRGELSMAEDSFRKALATKRSAKILNDLAWLLQEGGRLTEAQELVNEAITLDPRSHHGWDTQGVICLKQGKLDDAKQAFQKCLSIKPGHIGAMLRITGILITEGNIHEATVNAEQLDGMREHLSPQHIAELDKIRIRLERL